MHCPVCSEDEYVINGVCTGVFPAYSGALQVGSLPCRCSKKYLWSRVQREYQLSRICMKESLTFIGWKGEYIKNKSTLKWICSNGHYCETNLDSFMQNTRCGKCFRERQKVEGGWFGWYPSRGEEEDTLYVIIFNDEYVKVGRTFGVEKRLRELAQESGLPKSSLVILAMYKGSHSLVYKTEQYIHKKLKTFGWKHDQPWWTKEAFSLESLPVLKKLLLSCDLIEV